MSSTQVQNGALPAESKTSRKRKVKSAQVDVAVPTALPVSDKPASAHGSSAEESDSPYIRELQKNIRNVNKKITNASKTEGVVAEHKDKSLDDLLAAKLINADQKQQLLKKPALIAQAAQLEDQLAAYRKVDEDYRAKAAATKADLEKSLTQRYEKEKADAIAELTSKSGANSTASLREALLIVSRFLRLAAERRAQAPDASDDSDRAIEGFLATMYAGNDESVDGMLKLYQGADEAIATEDHDDLTTTYAQIKSMASESAPPSGELAAAATESSDEGSTPENPAEDDPTIAHAGLTEIEQGTDTALTDGQTDTASEPTTAGNGTVDNSAANAAAESQWDAGKSLGESQEWEHVAIPRDPAETDNGLTATPAANHNTQSWADDQPEAPVEAPKAVDANDGFRQVSNNRRPRREDSFGNGRGNHRGGFSSRGDRGSFRGGDRGRGSGRGGSFHRGGRGGGNPNGGNSISHRGPRPANGTSTVAPPAAVTSS